MTRHLQWLSEGFARVTLVTPLIVGWFADLEIHLRCVGAPEGASVRNQFKRVREPGSAVRDILGSFMAG